MVAYELHLVNLQVINYRDREGGGWRRSPLRPVQITIRDQYTPRDFSVQLLILYLEFRASNEIEYLYQSEF